ncbi:MAG TPA: helix-turn-helix transcriptional regulator [Thermoanaerobaculia bacterium]|nr:helix-turn-helix transcriptional regulator [Thermoanaerobaculia bacterium]
MGNDRERIAAAPLRPIEFHILLSLTSGERHGYGIIQDAEARGSRVDVGTLYRALARMADRGLIEAAARRGVAEAGEERRNYYRITAKGLRVGRAEARRVADLARAAHACGLLQEAGS